MTGRGVEARPLFAMTLWGWAGILVLAAHVGALLWVMREPPAMAAEFSPPSAIMIELAPEPEAVATQEDSVSPDETDAEEVASDAPPVEKPPEPEAEPPAVEPPPAEPPPEDVPAEERPTMAAPPEEPTEAVDPQAEVKDMEPLEPLPELAGVSIPMPTARPRPPERTVARRESPAKPPEKTRPRKAPETTKRQPASKAMSQAKAQVRQSDRTAASQTSSGYASPSLSPARWQSKLMSHLERRKRFPSGVLARGQVAVAHVRFSIDASGNVLSAALARSSGVPEIDSEVVALVRRASPVPAPPPGTNRTITAPIRFSVR